MTSIVSLSYDVPYYSIVWDPVDDRQRSPLQDWRARADRWAQRRGRRSVGKRREKYGGGGRVV